MKDYENFVYLLAVDFIESRKILAVMKFCFVSYEVVVQISFCLREQFIFLYKYDTMKFDEIDLFKWGYFYFRSSAHIIIKFMSLYIILIFSNDCISSKIIVVFN